MLFPKLVLAALVVLTFALVATFIPMKPAPAEQIAPNTNDKAINGLDPSTVPLIPKTIATTTTKMDNTLYSAFKNAIAPSLMLFAILAIFSPPTSCLLTQEDFQIVKK